MAPDQYRFQMAIRDFQSARQRAAMQEVLARVTGKSNALLSYEEMAQKLKLHVRSERGVKMIPVEAIVGSVDRYRDFTRTFLPRRREDQERWARVKAAFDESGAGLAPIEVYKVGETYFVLDGNHRVSIARQEGIVEIEAHVIELKTSVPITPAMRPEDLDALIIKAERADFLEETRIMDLLPNVDLSVTSCCQYEKILEQIRVREYLLRQDRQGQVAFQEAVLDWYEHVYTPLAEAIRDRGLLRWFPDRTLTDLFLWIYEYHAELEKETGWTISPETVAAAFSLKESPAAESHEASTGVWRESRLIERYVENLFKDILVPISGDSASWQALDQAIVIARHEGAQLHGLHVVASKKEQAGAFALQVQDKFSDVCARSNVKGTLFTESGDIVKKICERATLADLIVLKIVNPPQGGLSSLKSPFRAVINCVSRPILGVPGHASELNRALVAFDGSPKSREALFVGTYIAEQWKTSLTVFTALEEGRLSPSVQDYARSYLEFHEIEAEFVLESGSARALKKTIAGGGFDLVLLGSYSSSVFRKVFIGSTLDFALRVSQVPIFIFR